jgi:hypothetical protein
LLVQAGDTYLFDPNGLNQNHLWVVLATYVPELELEQWALMAYVTSLTARTQRHHRVCIVTPQDEDAHHFIHHASYILYSDLREFECAKLPPAHASDPVCEELLVRICRGAHTSKLTKRRLKNLVPTYL